MNSRVRAFYYVVWFGILANVFFAICAITAPGPWLELLGLGADGGVWLFNYSVLLILLSCFYIPAASKPLDYFFNSVLLVLARVIPASTFFMGVYLGFMEPGFLMLGTGDASIGILEGILLYRILAGENNSE